MFSEQYKDAHSDGAEYDETAAAHNATLNAKLGVDKKPFTVDSENAANWVLAGFAAVEEEARRIKAQTAQRLAELRSDADRLHARFDAELEAFAREEAARRRRKTITLTQGTLTLRAQPDRFVLADPDAAQRHAEAHRTSFQTPSPRALTQRNTSASPFTPPSRAKYFPA